MDSGILYWFLSRTRDRNANNIAFNGSTTFAQSNDIVAKTAYNCTVSGNVTIGSDGDGSYINFVWSGSWVIYGTVIPVWHTVPFTIILSFKTWSDVTSTQRILLNSISWTNRIWINIASGKIVVWMYNWWFIQKRNQNITINTMYRIVYTFDGTSSSLIVNEITATSTTNNPETSWAVWYSIWWSTWQFFTGKVYLLRIYSTALTAAQRTAELALWQKQTARKDCVLEILPNYFAGTTASPTTIYDVKAFTPYTPVVIQATFSKTASWSDNIVFTPYIWLQCLTGNIQSTIDQSWGKNSTYTVTHWPTFNAVVTWAFVNWSYVTKLFVGGVLRDSDTRSTWVLTKFNDYINLWRNPSNLYLTWTISNTKVFIWTITDVEWVAMSSWIPVIPVNATLFTQPRRLPPYWTAMTDVSGNWYDFTLTP